MCNYPPWPRQPENLGVELANTYMLETLNEIRVILHASFKAVKRHAGGYLEPKKQKSVRQKLSPEIGAVGIIWKVWEKERKEGRRRPATKGCFHSWFGSDCERWEVVVLD